MIQKIIKIGNSSCIVIPKAFMKAIGMKVGDEVLIQYNVVSGSIFIILKTRGPKRMEEIIKKDTEFWLKVHAGKKLH